MSGELARELAFYEAHKDEFLESHEGEFVLIKGVEVAGFYQSEQDAIAEGYRRFELTPFFVKQVTRIEPLLNYTRLMLGAR